jgi:hypothetical protein
MALLESLGLVIAHSSGDISVFAALARYRAEVRLPDTLDV